MIKVGTRGQKSLLSLALVLFLSDYIYSGTQVFAHSLFTDGIKGKDKGSHRINISYAKIEDCRFIVKRYNFLGSSFFYIPQFATTKPLPSQRVFDNNTKVNAMKDGKKIQIIEWHDMDKRRFYAYSLMLGTTIRFSVYPLNLIKTRLQAQEGKTAYRGTFDAVLKIAKHEGIRGFYKGLPISLFQVAAGQLYITTYETTKQTIFHNQSIPVQHFLGGFFASCISQTIMVPVDVISQYQQMSAAQTKPDMAMKVNASSMVAKYSSTTTVRRSVLGQAFYISQYLLKNEGLKGLYRGYILSLCTYGLNSGFYWGFYYLYSELLESFLPEDKTKLQEALRISASGVISSATAICLTNPIDVIRTRYQLQVRKGTGTLSGWSTLRSLLHSEGYKGLMKGMTARIAQSSFSSWALILGYEYVKKMSLKEDKNSRRSSDDGGFEAVTAFQKS